jgi:hypothetical protein
MYNNNLNPSNLKPETSKIIPINVDQLVSNLPKMEHISESEELITESDVTGPLQKEYKAVQPVSIKDQIMLNLNADSIIVGEEIVLDKEDHEVPLENKKVTQNIIKNIEEDFYKPHEHNASENLKYILDQKLEEEPDAEAIKKHYGKAKRITREDLDQYIKNGLRGTDSELKNRLEYQKQSMHRDPSPRVIYQKTKVVSEQPLPALQTENQIESRLKAEMEKSRESQILKGMRQTTGGSEKIYYKSSQHGLIPLDLKSTLKTVDPDSPLKIQKASIGPDIVRFTHENGKQPIVVSNQKYYSIKDLPDYENKIVYQQEQPIYETVTQEQPVYRQVQEVQPLYETVPQTQPMYETVPEYDQPEFRNTHSSHRSRGTYGGIGSMVMGGKSGMRMNYRNHLDGLYKGSGNKYY